MATLPHVAWNRFSSICSVFLNIKNYSTKEIGIVFVNCEMLLQWSLNTFPNFLVALMWSRYASQILQMIWGEFCGFFFRFTSYSWLKKGNKQEINFWNKNVKKSVKSQAIFRRSVAAIHRTVNYFREKALSRMFDRLLIVPLNNVAKFPSKIYVMES